MAVCEFRCQDCAAFVKSEVGESGSTDHVACEKCGSKRVKKTISASGFKIAGSGNSIPKGALSGCSSKSGFS